MPAGAWAAYGLSKEAALEARIDLDNDTFVCALIGTGYVPSINADDTWSDVSANELATGGGYTAGGVVLTGVTVTHSAGTVTFDCNDVSWATATFTGAKRAVIVRRAGGSLVAGDLLLCVCDLDTGGGTVAGAGGTFTIQINTLGVFTLT